MLFANSNDYLTLKQICKIVNDFVSIIFMYSDRTPNISTNIKQTVGGGDHWGMVSVIVGLALWHYWVRAWQRHRDTTQLIITTICLISPDFYTVYIDISENFLMRWVQQRKNGFSKNMSRRNALSRECVSQTSDRGCFVQSWPYHSPLPPTVIRLLSPTSYTLQMQLWKAPKCISFPI